MIEFITDKLLFGQINATPSQAQLFTDLAPLATDKNDYIGLYETYSLNWITAFLETLENTLLDCKSRTIRELAEINDLFIRIEEYIIESPDFLSYFPDTKKHAIYTNARYKLEIAQAKASAFNLIIDNQEKRFMEDFSVKIKLAGKSTLGFDFKIKIITNLIYYSPDLLTSLTEDCINLFRITTVGNLVEPPLWVPPLRARITREVKQWDSVLLYGEITPGVRDGILSLIRLIAALHLLDAECDHKFSVVLLRYLFLMSSRRSEVLKNKAFNALATMSYPIPPFSWEDLITFYIDQFTEKMSAPIPDDSPLNDVNGQYKGKGEIIVKEKQFLLQPFCKQIDYSRLTNFVHCLHGRIKIKSRYKVKTDINNCPDLSLLAKHWEAVLADFTEITASAVTVAKERPVEKMRLKIRITGFVPSMPLLAFATIVDDQYGGDGVLHASQISRIWIDSVEQVLAVDDIMTAVVIQATEDRLEFSLLEPLGEMLATRSYVGEITSALLVSQKNGKMLWCGEKGIPLYTPVVPALDIQVGETYQLKLIRVDSNGFIRARILEATEDARINPQNAVANLLHEYIDLKKETGICGQPDNFDILEASYLRQFINILDLFATSEADYRTAFSLLYTACLICQMCGETDAGEFFSWRLAYMKQVYQYTCGNEVDSEIIPDEALWKFPRLAEYRSVLSLLRNQSGDLLQMDRFLNSGYTKIARLARLLTASRLLTGYPQITEELKTEILSLLSFRHDEDDNMTEEINFGRENESKEFKSSLVYPPESNWAANVDKQSQTILRTICGFLNAGGGTLYIGVNDAGVPQGIEMDMQYLRCDEDKYELFLRREIVRHLGRDINSLILVEFQTYHENTICVITVPAYPEVVHLNGVVWQRQGNSTICLDAEAIRLLKRRRSGKETPRKPQSTGTQPEIGIATSVTPGGKVNPKEENKESIPTSCLQQIKNEKPLAFFSVLKSGKYIITTELPRRDDIRLTLPVGPGNQYDFLLQIYASGNVNRVAISNLLKKKREYEYTNALYNRSAIIFIGIAAKDDHIFIQTRLKNNEYVKIQSLRRIKINQDLSLKGTSLFSVTFDEIRKTDILTSAQAKKLKKLLNEDIKTLGSLTTSQSIADEICYLKELFQSGDISIPE